MLAFSNDHRRRFWTTCVREFTHVRHRQPAHLVREDLELKVAKKQWTPGVEQPHFLQTPSSTLPLQPFRSFSCRSTSMSSATSSAYTSVFITTATRHEHVHHDAASWACASRRCARCAGRSCARCSRQIVGCRAVRPSVLLEARQSERRRVQSFLTQVLSKSEQTVNVSPDHHERATTRCRWSLGRSTGGHSLSRAHPLSGYGGVLNVTLPRS